MRRHVLIAGLFVAAGCMADRSEGDPSTADSDTVATAADAPSDELPPRVDSTGPSADDAFFREARVLDLTGRGARDSVVITARGARLDSLDVRAAFYVDGREAFTETWSSSYELALEDSVRAAGDEAMATFLRARFAEELAAIERRPVDREQLELMGDTAVLREFAAPVTHEVVLPYGYETTIVLAYDEDDGVFRVLWSCC